MRGRGTALSDEQLGKQSVRHLINLFVTDAIETARAEIERRAIGSRRRT